MTNMFDIEDNELPQRIDTVLDILLAITTGHQ